MKILVTCNIKGGRRQTRRCTLVRDMGEPARIIPSIFSVLSLVPCKCGFLWKNNTSTKEKGGSGKTETTNDDISQTFLMRNTRCPAPQDRRAGGENAGRQFEKPPL